MKILIAEKTSPQAVALLRQHANWQVLAAEQLEGGLAQHLGDADALIVRSAVKVDAALLEQAPRLRVIGRAGVGVDNIDLQAATRRGIAVMNTPGASTAAVAEHTFALMLALARQLPRADSLTRAGQWEKKSLQGAELRAKTLGIIGLGRVGLEVARRALVFGMEVAAHDPFVSPGAIRELKIKLVGLDELLASADYLSLHVGLTPQTRNLISAAAIEKMKPGARLINCARGELVDEAALAAALARGALAGAALDVFREEPPRSSPLLGAPNLIATPHIAGSTLEAQEAVGVQIALQVRDYLKHGVLQNAVNVPSISHHEYLAMEPYITLAERLGAFLAQAVEGNAEEVSIRYSGEIAEWKTELIRNAALKGILKLLLSERANLVNAASLARERGLQVHEIKKPKAAGGGAGNVLSILFRTGEQEMLVRGAVLHGRAPRLLGVDEIDIEAPLKGHLLYLRNLDVPGVIGQVGTVLGNHGVNIANFALGREERESEARRAIAVVQVDSEIPAAALAELLNLEAITVARTLRLQA